MDEGLILEDKSIFARSFYMARHCEFSVEIGKSRCVVFWWALITTSLGECNDCEGIGRLIIEENSALRSCNVVIDRFGRMRDDDPKRTLPNLLTHRVGPLLQRKLMGYARRLKGET